MANQLVSELLRAEMPRVGPWQVPGGRLDFSKAPEKALEVSGCVRALSNCACENEKVERYCEDVGLTINVRLREFKQRSNYRLVMGFSVVRRNPALT